MPSLVMDVFTPTAMPLTFRFPFALLLCAALPAFAAAPPAMLDKGGSVNGIALFTTYMAMAPSAQVGDFAVMTRGDQAAMAEPVTHATALAGALAAPGDACTPALPTSALGRGRSGTTTVLLRVGLEGKVIGAKLTASSGFADLDQATIAAAGKCTFTPKIRNGVAIETSVVFTHVWKSASSPLASAAAASAPASRKPCARFAYPGAALANGEQGTVHMTLLIDVDGSVREKKVVKSSGSAELDRAALDGMAQCAFTPAITNGLPEKSLLSYSYTWTLH
ncbi:energy transducer TonB [Massilia sp. TWP1-3-3]|uniref:energy transducer TonB n=1 Tax=Massilia sp. TWP1-3-3 TaxID=2804573 RepID=UPI003CFB5D46